jgi:2,4-dienoyl-CoA reductase-like NADH-dependent reductase (Old Yellow Enzyme family)
MGQYDALFEPLEIKGLTIRNRIMSTSHSPAYAVGGEITERYRLYHAEKAKGGVGLTQFGGATGVSLENSYHYGQVNGTTDAVIPQYRAMAAGIHEHGAACMIQLTHGGRRERWDDHNWLPVFSASCRREIIHRSFPVEIEDHDIRRITGDYAQAVRRAREGDVDGIEISCQAGTLIEQFWSPLVNQRSDGYGGSLENRVRFGLEVFEAIRAEVGDDYIVGIRMPGDEMIQGGLTQEDCLAIARAYATSGMVDFISVVGAQASDIRSSALIWPTMWVPSAGFLYLASAIKAETEIPIFHASRITDPATAARAVEEGHLDMVGMTRALIADPHFVNKLREGREDEIRQCVGAGYCVDRVISGHDAVCIQNAATGREQTLPHVLPKAEKKRRAVVVGGGPGGMEAARVLAARGHDVVLFERGAALGGQVTIAAKAGWRESLSGVTRWFEGELARRGVEVRLETEAGAAQVMAEEPDIVIVATGGRPNKGWFKGAEHALSTWEVLSGEVEPGETVLLFDENGSHHGLSCAEYMAERGARVEIATPDRALGTELAETNLGAHMSELYKRGVVVSPDLRLTEIKPEGNKLVAVLANTYTEEVEERLVDQVVGEHGTLPNDGLYLELKPSSVNLGEADLEAMVAAAPQALERNPEGRFQLFRVGDAWASRNVHAAVFDSLRLCKDL